MLTMAVAERGSDDIALYQQLPATAPPTSTIEAPGAESFALGTTAGTSATLYVGEYPNAVATFPSPYRTANGTITAGVNDPASLAVGAVNGSQALFVANRGANDVTVYEIGDLDAPAFTIAGLSAPNGLAFDAHGDLWVSQSTSVVEFVPPFSGGSVPATTIASGLKSPSGIAFDPSGSLYVADEAENAIVVYPSGALTPSVTMTSGISGPINPLIVGTGLFVPNVGGNDIAEYSLPLTSSSEPVATNSTGMNRPSALTFIATMP
jgi:hypothetical protein